MCTSVCVLCWGVLVCVCVCVCVWTSGCLCGYSAVDGFAMYVMCTYIGWGARFSLAHGTCRGGATITTNIPRRINLKAPAKIPVHDISYQRGVQLNETMSTDTVRVHMFSNTSFSFATTMYASVRTTWRDTTGPLVDKHSSSLSSARHK